MKRPEVKRALVWTVEFRGARAGRNSDWTGPLGWGWFYADGYDQKEKLPDRQAYGPAWVALFRSRRIAQRAASDLRTRSAYWAPRNQTRVVKRELVLR